MSPKNAIKMINIQKYYLVHIGSIRSTLVHSAHFGSIWSTLSYSVLVLFSRHWSYSILCVPTRSTLVYFVLFNSLLSSLFPFSPILSIQSYFGPFMFTSVHLDHFISFLYTCIQGKDMFRLRALILNPNIYIYIYQTRSI